MASALLRPGSALGGYRIQRLLGRGATGAVYLAFDRASGRAVALKTLAFAQQFDAYDLAETRARFVREAQTASRLRHPNIVEVYGGGEERGIAYIAMQLLPGSTLVRYTSAARLLPEPLVLHIAAGIAEGLAHAHEAGIVHRDIKPANVMLDLTDRQPKITDFGIARAADSARTRTGLVLGTPLYMSPEQLAGAPPDGRSDLYALGVLLFQLLTAQLPYEAGSMGALLQAVATKDARSLRGLRPELPQPLDEFMARALNRSPHERFPDGRQFARGLRELAACWPGV